jgi:DNA-binding HxlR family transcriptional regulator
VVRAGSRALSVFSNALNARVLHAYAEGPLSPSQLEETLGWAPQSSLRATVASLSELGALARSKGSEGSLGASIELTTAGRELLSVAEALERWLGYASDGPVPLEDPAAQGTLRVLTAGWDSTMIRALAERPQTLIELSASISDLNYPALKRRLAKLRSTHLIIPVDSEGGTAYVASDWLRRAVHPLTLAGRWERLYDAGAAPISRVEIEAAFLLALPLAQLPPKSTGACTLAALMSEERIRRKRDIAGAAVEVDRGTIVSFRAETAATQPTWALGTVDAWLEAMVDGRHEALRIGGAKPRLAKGLVKALHTALFRL